MIVEPSQPLRDKEWGRLQDTYPDFAAHLNQRFQVDELLLRACRGGTDGDIVWSDDRRGEVLLKETFDASEDATPRLPPWPPGGLSCFRSKSTHSLDAIARCTSPRYDRLASIACVDVALHDDDAAECGYQLVVLHTPIPPDCTGHCEIFADPVGTSGREYARSRPDDKRDNKACKLLRHHLARQFVVLPDPLPR